MPNQYTSPAVLQRFLQYVDKHGPVQPHRLDLGPCWVWTGALYWKSGLGYGGFWWNGHSRLAHRVAYQLLRGPIPGNLTLDHLCHNGSSCISGRSCEHRRCVNPWHLEPVSRGTNVLRGNGITAKNVLKTHCPAGHPFTSENTYVFRKKRSCRRCHTNRENARRSKLSEQSRRNEL